MIVTIDIRMINHSGIGTYIKNVLPRVIKNCKDMQFILLRDRRTTFEWDIPGNTRYIDMKSSIYSFGEQWELMRKIPKETDLFWSPHINIPLFYTKKLLVTVHDVFFLAFPEFTSGVHKRIYANIMYHSIRKKAQSIITVSHFTKTELLKYTGYKRPEQINVIHIGVDSFWHEGSAKKVLDRPYVLYVGNVKPHKNVGSLIKAFLLLKDDIQQDLIIVGKKEGFITGDPVVDSLVKANDTRIQFTGFVSDERLREYYQNADLLVLPSLYEGFGLTPLEAMATGCPVLVSNCASLPEVCGDYAGYCDPKDINNIALGMKSLLSNSTQKEEMAASAKRFSTKYDWNITAEKTAEVIKGILSDESRSGT